ncbi:hypothetical protein [Thiolapillus sp.]
MYQPLSSLLWMLSAILPLLLWVRFQSAAACGLAFVLLAPVTAFMALNMLETALMRRRALIGMYLEPGSFLARLLCRKKFLAAWQVIKAVALALILFVEAPAWPVWLWSLLALNLILLPLVYSRIRKWIAPQLRAGRRNIVARRLFLSLNTAVLLLVLVVAQMFVPRSDYSRMSWEETSRHAVATAEIGCEYLAPLARLAALRDALTEWLIQRIPNHAWARAGAWVAYFLWSGLVFWAWNRLMLGGLGARDALRMLEDRSCD